MKNPYTTPYVWPRVLPQCSVSRKGRLCTKCWTPEHSHSCLYISHNAVTVAVADFLPNYAEVLKQARLRPEGTTLSQAYDRVRLDPREALLWQCKVCEYEWMEGTAETVDRAVDERTVRVISLLAGPWNVRADRFEPNEIASSDHNPAFLAAAREFSTAVSAQ